MTLKYTLNKILDTFAKEKGLIILKEKFNGKINIIGFTKKVKVVLSERNAEEYHLNGIANLDKYPKEPGLYDVVYNGGGLYTVFNSEGVLLWQPLL